MTSTPHSTPTVFSADEVLSRRHFPSYMMLVVAAGAINVAGLIDCRRYVTHISGTVTRIGYDFGKWTLMAEYLLVLMAFVVGAATSILPNQVRVLRGRRPLHFVPLSAVAALLVAIAIAGHFNVFGTTGGRTEEPVDFALMAALAFTMGLMNSAVAANNALSVRTTHMTGPASDFGVHLALALFLTGERRRQSLRVAALRGATLVAFALGAGLMVPVFRRFQLVGLFAPSALILIATLRSFWFARDRETSPAGAETAR